MHPAICTDTRKVSKDSLFFALKGENFDANTFAESAIEKGCSYAIIDNKEYCKSDKYIVVEDCLKTLQELAIYHRNKLNIPIIGITGTNGKTTTKELIKCVLSTKYKTYSTEGNYNNHIGVPLSILSINQSHEIAVIEMGASHQYDIAELCKIAQPNYGIITNIGKAHLEGYNSFTNLINTKKELYDYIRENNGMIFIRKDNEILCNISNDIKKYTYGHSDSDSVGRYVQSSPFMIMELVSNKGVLYIKTKLIGDYNYENVLAAATIGRFFNIVDLDIKKAIESYIPSNNRSQLLKTKDNTLILDLYNANPSSVFAAITNFDGIEHEGKMLILGDMLELGDYSEREHERVLHLVDEIGFDNAIFVGSEYKKLQEQTKHLVFKCTAELIEYLKKNKPLSKLIIIKGSRGLKLEQCIDFL